MGKIAVIFKSCALHHVYLIASSGSIVGAYLICFNRCLGLVLLINTPAI